MDENYEKRGYLLEDFRLFHLKDDRGTKVDYHYHEFCKIVLLLSGSGSYTVEGRRYLLLPGDIVLVGKRCVHKPEFEEGISYERMILYISPSLLADNSVPDYSLEDVFSGKPGHVLRPAEDTRRRLRLLAEQLESEMAASGGENAILSRCTLLRLLVEIGRAMQRTGSELPQPVVPRDGKILEILRYLEANLAEDISIDDLAGLFYISKYHMMRRFREETGTSIHNYLSDKRLLAARDLIASGTAATDACFRCGFRSYSAFSRAYGKLFGVTPTGRIVQALQSDDFDE